MHTKLILVAAIATTATVAAMPATCAAAGTTVTVPLALIKSVDLPGIEGDFDHFTADVKGNRLFLAAEEHHSVEVFDLQTGATLHSIDGLDTPHSILYAADGSRLFVIDGGKGGSCEVFDAASYKHLKSIKLTADADPMVYDMAKHLLYVGNGGKEAGNDYSLVTVIDTTTATKVADIKLPSANLEAMALQASGSLLYVNMRDKNQVGVVDRQSRKLVATWQLTGVAHNTPMVLDETNSRLMVAGRKPGVFAVLNTRSGKEIMALPACEGVDDMSFDPATKRIYLACADGHVGVFRQLDADHYEALGQVATGNRGKIGVLVRELHRYYVSTAKSPTAPARLFIFKTLDQ